jgi:hypothetical protein
MYLQKITLQGVASYLSNSKSTLMAGNMNMVLLIGRLGADPQIFTFEDGGAGGGYNRQIQTEGRAVRHHPAGQPAADLRSACW